MDHFSKLSRNINYRLIFGFLIIMAIGSATAWILIEYADVDEKYAYVIAVSINIFLIIFFAKIMSRYFLEPIRALSQAIIHVSPNQRGAPAPNLDTLRIGRELVTNLALQVYELASSTPTLPMATGKEEQNRQAQIALDGLPIPIFMCNNTQTIQYINPVAAQYLGKEQQDIIGKNIYSVLDFSFSDEETLDTWLASSRKNNVTAIKQWDRVRLNIDSVQKRKQCDVAAYYNKNNPNNIEMVIALFDKTKFYMQDDDAISFIALAVHELRTPLTILQGYIEVFDEEVSGSLSKEMRNYMHKMQASAQQLASFVKNILNVARIEENQLFLQLREEDWAHVLSDILDDIELRASVYGKKITCNVDPNLPKVAIDRISIYEVMNNLIENAIKYSGKNPNITIKTLQREDGMIETTVQDFGIGIPSSTIGNLFEKFYRNHRSRAQYGGTGLGLYLSKSIVTAHGGQIWVHSEEGKGSTFGFTIQPYQQLAKSHDTQDNKDIVRTAHGWIKNHSFYRRS